MYGKTLQSQGQRPTTNQGKRRATLHIPLTEGFGVRRDHIFGSSNSLKSASDESKSESGRNARTYQAFRFMPKSELSARNLEFHPQDSNLVHYAYPIGYDRLAGKTIIGVKFPHRRPIETKGPLLRTKSKLVHVHPKPREDVLGWKETRSWHHPHPNRTHGSTALLSNEKSDGLAQMTENRPNKGRNGKENRRAQSGRLFVRCAEIGNE
ncbi:hypothetical protein ARMSODRAFT_976543 [Armillaria solidipes]|uniref:Uncharacterized protein n=1 Tax=Armillaria solidipes TaxID=1076256 RepID=A0A2H3BDP3_9AGAR|nr:hypothetical protein ARMSODRAFT_976543 [Armillaria solidipes]